MQQYSYLTDETDVMNAVLNTNNKNQDFEQVFGVIQKSFSIQKHVDFFNWLQGSVREVLPHDVLVSAWGDFASGDINFDVCSNIDGISTKKLIDAPAVIAYLMTNLHRRWVDHGEKWFRINFFNAEAINPQLPTDFSRKLGSMNSLLVYGVRDTRGHNDCIYVFFDKARQFAVPHPVLGHLMPHLDAALRRVNCLHVPHVTVDEGEAEISGLTEREQEILQWVKSGKTNFEIGIILTISPNTVKNHLKRIFNKLDVSSRMQAIAKFVPQSMTS